jgi:ATP-dependent DNA helicase PIF1
LLEYFRLKTSKNIIVLAPTGVAAIKARGQTIHSFFKLPPRFIQQDHIRRIKNRDLLKRVDAVVIDECSMVRADLLDGVDYSLRINREVLNKPFGGVQVILFGDLFQLPPVVERDIRKIMDSKYKSPYFFSAKVLQLNGMKYFELTKIYRQKDENFIALLNKIRVKNLKESDLENLNKRVNTSIKHENGIITLNTTNSDANTINEDCLSKIPHKEFKYNAEIWGKFDEKSYPAEVCIRLKKNAQVMLIKNDRDKRWVNGTIAEIIDLSIKCIKVKIGNNIYDVPKVSWDKIEYVFNHEKDKIEEKVIGSFKQYPIKLAWAITIHKSQGQTFRNVIIDMGFGAFTHGQTYVALSRCTSLEGLFLKRPIIASDIIFDNRIYQFQEKYKNKVRKPQEVPQKNIVAQEEKKIVTAVHDGPKYKKEQYVKLPNEKNVYTVEYVYGKNANGNFEYRLASGSCNKVVEEQSIAGHPAGLTYEKKQGSVVLRYNGDPYDNQRCIFEINVTTEAAKETVLDINRWTYTKVRSQTANRNLKVLSNDKLRLVIEGEGFDNRCRWCRTFRTGLKTACEKNFGGESFNQEGYCQHES